MKAGVRTAAYYTIPVLCAAILGLAVRNSTQTGSIQDDARFIDMATALARGLGYVRPWTPRAMPETWLPPGYPILLWPLRWLFPGSFLPLQMLSLGATLGIVLVCAWYDRQYLEEPLAWLTTLFVAVNVGLVAYSVLVMSEAVYTFLSMVVIALVCREEKLNRNRAVVWLAVGLLVTLAYFVRSRGLALTGALVVYFLFRRRWVALAMTVAPFLLAYEVWGIRNVRLAESWSASLATGPVTAGATAPAPAVSYGQDLSTVLHLVSTGSKDLVDNLGPHWLRDLPRWFYTPRTVFSLQMRHLQSLESLFAVAVLLLLLAGYIARLRHKPSVAEVYVPLFAVLVSVGAVADRYWVPLLPILILYFTLGLQAILTWVLRPGQRRYVTATVAVLLVTAVALHVRRDLQDVSDPPHLRITDVAVAPGWLAQNAPAGALVMAETPRVSYLYSNLPTIPFPDSQGEVFDAYVTLPATDNAGRLNQILAAYPVRYIVLEPSLAPGSGGRWSATARQVAAQLDRDKERFRQVFADESGLVRIFQVQR